MNFLDWLLIGFMVISLSWETSRIVSCRNALLINRSAVLLGVFCTIGLITFGVLGILRLMPYEIAIAMCFLFVLLQMDVQPCKDEGNGAH